MAKKKKEKKQLTPGRQRVRMIFRVLLLLVLLTILTAGIVFYMTYGQKLISWRNDAVQLVRSSTTDTFRQTETSLVYDTEGKLLSELKGEKDVYYVSYEDIPEDVKKAMISIEDKQFETHNGIDMKGIARAIWTLIKHKGEITQGASTITQQLSRNIFLTHEVSYERKIKEMFIAMELEKKYSKAQIMEFYLNNIYFGNGYYGIQAASDGYLSKDIKELSLGEIAFLCAIPNNPTLYDPMDNMDNTHKRKVRILGEMLEDGVIDAGTYSQACNDTITLEVKSVSKKNYIETYVYNCAVKALMKSQGFIFRYEFQDEADEEDYNTRFDEAYAMCQQSLYSSGYRIYTSIDRSIQKQLQTAVNENLAEYKEKNEEGIYKLQGAATCIENKTGRVVAVVGGRTQKTEGYTLNRAYQTFRQPGSAIKPLIVYTPVFEQGKNPETVVEDKKREDGPKNSNDSYEGEITIRRAVEVSKNTVAWDLFEDLSPSMGLQYLLNMNFSKIDERDYYPAAALGGFTTGVSTVEMASAYAALANSGVYREPTCIVKIMDTRGNVIVSDELEEKIVYEANAARMMTDVLEDVMTDGTARGLALDNMACAGKTGTTNDKKDGWFVGYTPYYTTSVWVGYDIPKEMEGLTGASYPGGIWKDFMNVLHEGLEHISFIPYEVEGVEVTKPTKKETEPKETEPETESMWLEEEMTIPEEETKPDEDIEYPEEEVELPDEEVTYPEEEVELPDEEVTYPEEEIVLPEEEVEIPELPDVETMPDEEIVLDEN